MMEQQQNPKLCWLAVGGGTPNKQSHITTPTTELVQLCGLCGCAGRRQRLGYAHSLSSPIQLILALTAHYQGRAQSFLALHYGDF